MEVNPLGEKSRLIPKNTPPAQEKTQIEYKIKCINRVALSALAGAFFMFGCAMYTIKSDPDLSKGLALGSVVVAFLATSVFGFKKRLCLGQDNV